MICVREKLALGGALTGLAGAGVIAITGAPTVILTVAGGAAAVAALTGVIMSLMALSECYARHGKTTDADKVARKVERLEAQLAELRTRFGLA